MLAVLDQAMIRLTLMTDISRFSCIHLKIHTMSSTNPVNQEARLVLCKISRKSKKGKWFPQKDRSVLDLHGRLLRAFEVDDTRSTEGIFKQALLWHNDHELCRIQRALDDINKVSQATLDDCIICLYTYDQSEDDGSQQVNKSQKVNKAPRTTQGQENASGKPNTASTQESNDAHSGRCGSQDASGITSLQQDAPDGDSGDDQYTGQITLLAKFESLEKELPLPKGLASDQYWYDNLDWGFHNVVDFSYDKTAEGIQGVAQFDRHPDEITFRPIIKLDGERGRYAKFDIYESTQIERIRDIFTLPPRSTTLTMEMCISSKEEPYQGTVFEKLKDYHRSEPVYYHIGKLGTDAAVGLAFGETSANCAPADKDKNMKCAPTDHVVLGLLIGRTLEMDSVPEGYANGHSLGYVHFGTRIQKIPRKVNVNAGYNIANTSTQSISDFLDINRETALGTALQAKSVVPPF